MIKRSFAEENYEFKTTHIICCCHCQPKLWHIQSGVQGRYEQGCCYLPGMYRNRLNNHEAQDCPINYCSYLQCQSSWLFTGKNLSRTAQKRLRTWLKLLLLPWCPRSLSIGLTAKLLQRCIFKNSLLRFGNYYALRSPIRPSHLRLGLPLRTSPGAALQNPLS